MDHFPVVQGIHDPAIHAVELNVLGNQSSEIEKPQQRQRERDRAIHGCKSPETGNRTEMARELLGWLEKRRSGPKIITFTIMMNYPIH